jgi:F-type H+-transporting ATPase subunit b
MTVFGAMAASQPGGPVGEIARTFGVDWPHLMAQVIGFSIVCALLYWLAYEPVLRALADRRARIADGLANAKRIEDRLAAVETERQHVLTAAQTEGARIIDEARAAGRRVTDRETARATAAAEQIVRAAHEAASRERRRMEAELRRELGRLVVRTTAAVTGKILSPEDQRRLAEETARHLS